MPYIIRHYRPDADDLPRMIALIQDAWLPQRRPNALFHVGDLYWRLREPAYEQMLWLWEDDGAELAAFMEWDADGMELNFQAHPRYAGGLESDLLAWMENEAPRRQTADASGLPSPGIYAAETDTAFLALLDANGYRRDDHTNHYQNHLRSLHAQTLETPPLPDGYIVRHLNGPEEIEARVAGHRAGWQSTKMTAEIYRRMMAFPGYRTELDIVVVAPDGTIVSTCNCWLDERSGAGLFEPVSTHPEHRRKGLGRALICKGLQQLQALGARTAWVSSVSGNPPSTALYESCGLAVVCRDYAYRRIAPG